MQLAHPSVAQGVADHSDFADRPLDRLVATFEAMFLMSFGSKEQAKKVKEDLDRIHGRVVGQRPDGVGYSANDPVAQAWVFATLIDSLLVVEKRFRKQLDDDDRSALFSEALELADSFGIREQLPASLDEFREWLQRQVEHLEPSEASRQLAGLVISPKIGIIPTKALWPMTAIALDMLPPTLREKLDLPALMPSSVAWVQTAERVVGGLCKWIPESLQLNPIAFRLMRRN